MAGWIADSANYVFNTLSGLMTRLIAAVIIVLIGFIVGRVLGKLMQKLLHELEVDRILKKTASVKFSIEKAVGKFIAYFIYFLAIILALNQLGLTTTILHMVSAAILIIIILSVVLGIKDFIPNLLAGMQIHKKGMLKKGDFIRVRGTEGRVMQVELTETKLRTPKGDTIYMPNSLLIKEEIVKLKRKK